MDKREEAANSGNAIVSALPRSRVTNRGRSVHQSKSMRTGPPPGLISMFSGKFPWIRT
jgi:hypothetical protein